MSSDVVEKLNSWVSALESGEYKQGEGCLLDISSADPTSKFFCCLGVLTEIDPRYQLRDYLTGEEWSEFVVNPENDFPPSNFTNELYLNTQVKEILKDKEEEYVSWCKEKEIEESYLSGEEEMMSGLANLNDIGVPFKDIASFIKKFHIPYVEKKLNECGCN